MRHCSGHPSIKLVVETQWPGNGPTPQRVLFGMGSPSQIAFPQGSPQPVVLAGNGTVNVGEHEACWQPLPGIENEDTETAVRILA